ncbi:MAG TPA: glycosyltransferase family 2 protein [Gemmatimonadaceae bacterium]|nr:glycosyltransferase family 2 protein [Gemmatimonadaceae bacterium]
MIAPVACIVPALDAERTLPGVAARLRTAVPHATLIAVDDGSVDGTRAVAARACDIVLAFEHNRGKGAALRAGFAEALRLGMSAVLTIDADGQHAPEDAPRLLAALAGADLAIGARTRSGAMPLGRRLTNALATAAVGAVVGGAVADAQSGYRAMRRAVLERVRARGDRYEFETDFLIRAGHAGFRIAAVPIPTVYGARSHFRGFRDSVRVVRTIWRYRAGAFQ